MPPDPSDVWSAAAPPAGARAAPSLIAYVDSTSVGFDLRLSLPPVCVRCGARERISPLTLKLKIRGDLVARAAAFAQGGRAAFGAAVAPVWIIALAIGAGAIQSSLAGWAVLAGLALFAFLGLKLFVKRTSALKLERVDGDGIVRLGNVHQDAGQAIVDAASAT